MCPSAPCLRGLTLTVFIVRAALPLRSVSRPPERNRNNRTRTINQPYTRAALPLRRSAKRDVAIFRKGRRNYRTRLNKFSPAQTQSRVRIFPKPISRSSSLQGAQSATWQSPGREDGIAVHDQTNSRSRRLKVKHEYFQNPSVGLRHCEECKARRGNLPEGKTELPYTTKQILARADSKSSTNISKTH